MRRFRLLKSLAATTLVISSLSAGSQAMSSAAHAQQTFFAICTDGGLNNNGDCLNNWNDDGNVYEYTAGASNEEFGWETIDRCGGGFTVTSTCPFTDTSMDVALEGAEIMQIAWISGEGTIGGCVSDPDKTGAAVLGTCNAISTGSGGSFASVFVLARNGSLVDLGWTNAEDTWVQAESNGSGSQISFYPGGSDATEWNIDTYNEL
jgi:hypothetical protein